MNATAKIEALGPEYDIAIDDATISAAERGFNESEDREAFWTEVLAIALATVDAE